MKRLFSAGFVSLAAALLISAPASAQGCMECWYSSGQHRFPDISCGEDDPGCFDCASAPEGHIGCHTKRVDGECSPSGHEFCGQVIGALELEAVQELRSANWNRLGRFAALHDAVIFNADRNAIQILGCNGGVAVHIPLPETAAEAVRRQVAGPENAAFRHRYAQRTYSSWRPM